MKKFLILAAIVAGIALTRIIIGAVVDTLNPSWKNTHKDGACSLNATVAVVPFSSSQHPGELRITNRDEATWNGAQLSLSGTIATGPSRGTETGVHRITRDITPGLTAIPLSDFANNDGTRWVPSTMHADRLAVSATLRTEKCEWEQQLR